MSMNRRLFIGSATSTALFSAGALSARASSFDSIVDRFRRNHGFSGSVALGRNGQITHQRLFGVQNRDLNLPMGLDTMFRIGSVSKFFTAVVVLRLIERGMMSLDAPIGFYLPSLTGPYGTVPIVHLLSNNSGIPDRVSQAVVFDPSLRNSHASSADMVAKFGEGTLSFQPGDRFDYALFNWVLIHAAIERVTGLSFEKIVSRELFIPLRLRRSGFIDTRHGDVQGLAQAYALNGERKDARVPPFAGASGNIYMSANDLIRAAHLIFETDRILTPDIRTELIKVRVPEEQYALGGRVKTMGHRKIAWETGKVQAYRTHLAHVIGESRAVVLLNNGDMDQAIISTLVDELLQLN